MKRKGFSFTEVLIAVITMGLVMAGTLGVLIMGNDIWSTETVLVELQEQVRLSLAGISREVRQADSYTITGGTQITFTIPASANPINYYLSGGQIIRAHAGTSRILANNISALTFSESGNNAIGIAIMAQKTYRGRTYNFSLQGNVELRNE